MYQRISLPNHLRLITAPMLNTKTVTVLLMVRAGTRYEREEINGISHLLEHMFFKGTKRCPSTLKLVKALDEIGGEYNAFTTKEFTGFYAKATSQYLEILLDFVSDIYQNSLFNPLEIEKEKQVILQEIALYEDTPTSYIYFLFEKLLYKPYSLSWLTLGTKESVLSLDKKKLVKYLITHYTLQNTALFIAGEITIKNLKFKIKNYFKKLIKEKITPKIDVQENQTEPAILIYPKKTDQIHLALGVRTFGARDPNIFTLKVLATILGGGMSSRLFTEIRERRGLAYYVQITPEHYTDLGYLVVNLGVAQDKVKEVVEIVLREFSKLKEKKIVSEELKKAKEYLKGKLALNLETSDEIASWLAEQEFLRGEILTPQEVIKQIERVESQDIQDLAQKIFLENKLNLALIGPIKDEDRLKELLKF